MSHRFNSFQLAMKKMSKTNGKCCARDTGMALGTVTHRKELDQNCPIVHHTFVLTILFRNIAVFNVVDLIKLMLLISLILVSADELVFTSFCNCHFIKVHEYDIYL